MSYINKKSSWLYILVAIMFVVVGVLAYALTLDRSAPKIIVQNEVIGKDIYWNLQNPIKIDIGDASGIKSYEVTFNDGQSQINLDTKVVKEDQNSVSLEISSPKNSEFLKATNGTLKIVAFDNSKWNFFKGNEAIKTTNVIIDRRSPIANVITNSYLLRQGGSGVLIVEVADDNLKDYYVTFNDEVIFELFPFYKKNYYISIITWPIDIKEFKRVNLVAIDMAGNKSVTKIPYYIQPFKEKVDELKISDEFANNISKKVLEESNMPVPLEPAEIFVKANKELRQKNLQTMKEVVVQNFKNNEQIPFNVKPFVRLPNAATFAMFGERRHYFYGDQKIDEAWHLGMDWASVKRADINITNPGKVIFKDYLGIYGNSIIVDHGLGLASLYAHTSSQNVEVGDFVTTGQHIANTGATGAVFGDHLHFGILIQGIEANPNEWLDVSWMNKNLDQTMKDAIKIIDGKK